MLRCIKNTIIFFLSISLITLFFFPLSDIYSSPSNDLDDSYPDYNNKAFSNLNANSDSDSDSNSSSNSDSTSTPTIIDVNSGLITDNSIDYIHEDHDFYEVMQELGYPLNDDSIADIFLKDLVRKKDLNQKEAAKIKLFFEGLQRHFYNILKQYDLVSDEQNQNPLTLLQNLQQNLLPDNLKNKTPTSAKKEDPNIPILLKIVEKERSSLLLRRNLKKDILSGVLNGVKTIQIQAPDDYITYGIKFYYIENADKTAAGTLISIRLYEEDSKKLANTSYNILLSSDYAAYRHQINTLDLIDTIKSALSFDKELIQTLLLGNYSEALRQELESILPAISRLEEEVSNLEKNTKRFISEDKKQFSKELNKILSNLKTLNSCDVIDLAYDPSNHRLAIISTDKAPKWGTLSYMWHRFTGAAAPAELSVGLVSMVLQAGLTFVAVYLKYCLTPGVKTPEGFHIMLTTGTVYSIWSALFAFGVGTYGVTYKNLMDRVSDNYSSDDGLGERIIKEVLFSLAFAGPMIWIFGGYPDGTGHINEGFTLKWLLYDFALITILVKCSKDIVFAYFRQIRKLKPQDATQVNENSIFRFTKFNVQYQTVYNCLSFFPKILGLLGTRICGFNLGDALILLISTCAMKFNHRWAKNLYSTVLDNYFKAIIQSEDFKPKYGSFSEYINTILSTKDVFDEDIVLDKFGVELYRTNLKDVIKTHVKLKYINHWFSSSNKIREHRLSHEPRYIEIISEISKLTDKIDRIYDDTGDMSDIEPYMVKLIELIIKYDILIAKDEYIQSIEESVEKKGNIIDRGIEKVKNIGKSIYSSCTYYFTRTDSEQ